MSRLRIKEILRARHISAARLAEMLGVSPQCITPIVNNRQSPTLKTLDRIAECLEVPVVELFSVPEDHITRCPYCSNILRIDKDEQTYAEEQFN